MKKFIYWTLPLSLHCLLPILLFITGVIFHKMGGYRLIELYEKGFDWSPSAGIIVASYLLFCSWMVIVPSYIYLVALSRLRYATLYWVGFWAVVMTLFSLFAQIHMPFKCLTNYMIVILYLIPFTYFALRLHRGRDRWLSNTDWIESLKRLLTWQRLLAATCISFMTAIVVCFVSVWISRPHDKNDTLRFDPATQCSYEFTNQSGHGYIKAKFAGGGGTIAVYNKDDSDEWTLGSEREIDREHPLFSYEIYQGEYRIEYTPKHPNGNYGDKVEVRIIDGF